MSSSVPLKDCKALILVGEPDFGRCPLASRLHHAFWSFGGKPVFLRLVEILAEQGLQRVEVCSSERNRPFLESLVFPDRVNVHLRFETFPRGTAGNIRDALAAESPETILLVFNGAMLAPPPLKDILEEHQNKQGVLTVFFQPTDESEPVHKDAEVYVCCSDIIRQIPPEGYFDLKENLVPALVKKGLPVACGVLKKPTETYRTWMEYVEAAGRYLSFLEETGAGLAGFSRTAVDGLWVGQNVQIDPTVRTAGPVFIGNNSIVKEGCILLGPLMVESDGWIGPHAVISFSVIGAGTTVGAQCRLDCCMTDTGAVLPSGTEGSEQLFVLSRGKLSSFTRKLRTRLVQRQSLAQVSSLSSWLAQPRKKFEAFLALGVLLIVLFAVHWNLTLIDLWQVWMLSDEYSSGILVPLLAAYVIWDRRKILLDCPIRPYPPAFWALLFVQILRFGALLMGSASLERLCFLLTIGGLVWLILGGQCFKKILPVWMYLYLMFPLPKSVEWTITPPLQKWATVSAVFCLEALGFNVIRDGNIININGTLVAVAEACNGLRMLTAFFVVSGFVVLICKCPLWQKVVIFLSSVPIALICNTIRLVLTSIAFLFLDGQIWEKIFHDYGGLAMMPLALLLTVLELRFLSKLFIDSSEQTIPKVVCRQKSSV